MQNQKNSEERWSPILNYLWNRSVWGKKTTSQFYLFIIEKNSQE